MINHKFVLLFYKSDPELNYKSAESNISIYALLLVLSFLIISIKQNYSAAVLLLTFLLIEAYFSLAYIFAKKAQKLDLDAEQAKKAYELAQVLSFFYVQASFALLFVLDAINWLDLKEFKRFLEIYYTAYLILTIINFLKYQRKNGWITCFQLKSNSNQLFKFYLFQTCNYFNLLSTIVDRTYLYWKSFDS